MAATIPRRELGRYTLFGEIGVGGMATVHYARLNGAVGFGRTVAMKRLHPQFARDPEFHKMLLDEARLASRIRHPNVVATLDVVEAEEEIFLVMDYVHGESLSHLMKAHPGGLAPSLVATIMTGVLHGLHAAHEAKNEEGEPLGIVHRDVSPQNILVGTDGSPRILDFGIAKAAGRSQKTREGLLKGKLGYMAPEHLEQLPVGRQADVYAAAVVCWELLTGQRLFQGESDAAIMSLVLKGKIELPSRLAPGVPRDFDTIVLKGLSSDPTRRFATARAMALEIERSVPLATSTEVGEWVDETASETLRKRAHHVAEMERDPSSRSLPEDESQTEVPVSSVSREVRRRSRRPGIVFGVAALTALAGAAMWGLRGRATSAGERAATATATANANATANATAIAIASATANATANATATAIATATPTPTPTVTPTATPTPTPTPTPTATPTQHPALPSSAKTAPSPGCDPPYYSDPSGHRHYKPECFRQ